jgi:hypothetical protein
MITKYYYDNCIKEDEMGRACSMLGEMYTKFWSENLKVRENLEDLGIE